MVTIPAWVLLFICGLVPLVVYWWAYRGGWRDGYWSGMKSGAFVRDIEQRGHGHEL